MQLSVAWRQRHELLRLELPLAQTACRWAADTGGGVIERPAHPSTAREQARWEVPAISWLASQAPAGGLGVLLDGPQGVSGAVDRLGVSLLRGPTWPDPSADNGDQRLRLALVPCVGGWRQQCLPQLAQRFREPPWLRPAPAASGSPGQSPPAWALGGPHLQLLGLRPAECRGEALLAVQNLSPLRQHLQLPPGWCLAEGADAGQRQCVLGPWQLLSCRLRPKAQSS
jgi:alpha-mannosidase